MTNNRKPGTGNRKNAGQGRKPDWGNKGNCICSSCGEKQEHQRGVPCNTVKCPKCGANMNRE